MRGTLASLLLALFGFSLIEPMVVADSEWNLPECCRRSGKHHCAMMMDEAPVNGVAFRSVQSRCPLYPSGQAAPACQYAVVLTRSDTMFSAVVSHPAIHLQTEAGYRISFSRSCQKRGPPVVLS